MNKLYETDFAYWAEIMAKKLQQKEKRLKKARKENCLYCYELDEYFCHKFEKVKVE